MKNLILLVILTIVSIGAACGRKTEATNENKTAMDNKTTSPDSPTGSTISAASNVVKDIYDDAMRRNCSAIPARLTEEFKKSFGTGKNELDALCDTFTDSGKLAGFEVKSENLSGDSATVKVALVYKDGRKEEKTERVKKTGDKWLMDS